jgi:predicted peroxiredoxin
MALHERLAILVYSARPERPELAAAPLVYAAAAAALDAEVEVHFTGPAVRFLVEGEAARLRTREYGGATLDHFLRQAAAAGVKLIACGAAYADHVRAGEPMIEGYTGQAGAAAFAARALDGQWRTLVF